MFQSVRANSPIYILHTGDELRSELGYVLTVSMPKPKYAVPSTFGTPQEMVVDLVVKAGEHTYNFNSVPSNLDSAETVNGGESLFITSSRDAVNAELLRIKQKSVDNVNSYDYNKKRITSCDKLLSELNPEFAEKQTQKAEIEKLKTQMLENTKALNELIAANRLLVEKLSLKPE